MARCVLSVEDDESAQYLIEVAFRELAPEIRLYRATNGIEALDFLARIGQSSEVPRPDLILSNLHMPEMTGVELLATLKKDDRWRDIPVVMFSSSQLDSDRARCLAAGARDFMVKSPDFDDFLGSIQSACRHISSVRAESA